MDFRLRSLRVRVAVDLDWFALCDMLAVMAILVV